MNEKKIVEFIEFLQKEEKSFSTCQQYYRDIQSFFKYLGKSPLTKEMVICYKEELETKYQPISVNTKLAAINSFFAFIGRNDCRVKLLKIQKRAYCSKEKELTKGEYIRLVKAAKNKNNEKLALLLQTICGTGIRVSELCFITVEAVQQGEAVVQLKGKTRVILIGEKLQRLLKKYIYNNKIVSGSIFITRNGKAMDRSNIWKMMKRLCEDAHVDEKKVFPHNLRHLFARCFYSIDKDIAMLADLLGHSNVNTTRIYTISSGEEHREKMNILGLVV